VDVAIELLEEVMPNEVWFLEAESAKGKKL
jgi:hypothetical protein